MAESEKPFICYKAGLKMSIQPRNRAGWIYFTLWMTSLIPLILGFTALLSTEPTGAWEIAVVVGFLLLVTIWAIAMIVWMKNRSEVVDMNELMKIKRELDAKKRRGRGG
ncbi:MAG: hypothetical protein RL299_1668 [Pseudomonadota bacterium]|jgi:uncharacterized membrane protein (DUF485 family)